MKTRKKTTCTKQDTSLEDQGLVEVKFINAYIGSGVYAKLNIKKGTFICVYSGENVSEEEGLKRLERNSQPGCYLFFYKKDGKKLCMDGTHSFGVGKFINDDHKKPNSKVKLEVIKGKHVLAVYALKDISEGVEIRYDYGDSHAHWRKKNAVPKILYAPPGIKDNEPDVTQPDDMVCQNMDKTEYNGVVMDSSSEVCPLVNQSETGIKDNEPVVTQPDDMVCQNMDKTEYNGVVMDSSSEVCPLVNQSETGIKDNEPDVTQPDDMVCQNMDKTEYNGVVMDSSSEVCPLVNQSETGIKDNEPDVTQPDDMVCQNMDKTEYNGVVMDSSSEVCPLVNQSETGIKDNEPDVTQPDDMVCQNMDKTEYNGVVMDSSSEVCPLVNQSETGIKDNEPDVTQPDDMVCQNMDKTEYNGVVMDSSSEVCPLVNQSETGIKDNEPDVTQPDDMVCQNMDKTEYNGVVMDSSSEVCPLVNQSETGIKDNEPVVTQPDDMVCQNMDKTEYNGVVMDSSSEVCPLVNQSETGIKDNEPDVTQPDDMVCQNMDKTEYNGVVMDSSSEVCPLVNQSETGIKDNEPVVTQPDDMVCQNMDQTEYNGVVMDSSSEVCPLVNQSETDKSLTVHGILFSGVLVNYGFFKLFTTFKIAASIDDTSVLVVPASSNGHTKNSTIKVFKCLLGRKNVVSYNWIKDSIRLGKVQDIDHYLVKSVSDYGEVRKTEGFEKFEFQIRGKKWNDIKEEDIRDMLLKIGGIETMNIGPETIILCADDEIHTSDQCVGKEWLFTCIVEGVVKPIPRQVVCYCSDSEEERSAVIELDPFPFSKRIRVQLSKSSFKNSRSQKFQACVYCGKLDKKISRHMINKHSEEHEVAIITNMKKGSSERRKALIKLAAKGNYSHNSKVKSQGFGVIIPKYRPSQANEETKYLPCEYCTAFIVDRDLWKHHKTCVAKPEVAVSDGPVRNSRLLLPKPCSDQLFKDVISKLRDDPVAAKIKSDSLILEFGQRRYDKTGKYHHTHSHISQRLRELSRFLIRAKTLDTSLKELSDCINPLKWATVLKAVRIEAGFSESTQSYNSPSFAVKCGHSLKKCAKILRNLANERGDERIREMCIKFLENYEDEYGERIDGPARDCLNGKKYNCPQLLPLAEDVVKLSDFIKFEIEKVKSQLKDGKGREQYTRLCKLILAQVILFNRKRSGEASRISKESFSKGLKNPDIDDAVKESLTKFEQKLCESHNRVEIRGKRGRKVAVLFTNEMKNNTELLIKMQKEVEGWNPENIFVPINYQIPYRGSKVLKEISKEADLKDPNRITSTNLRKQLATMCQVFSLNENSQDILARFMGHDIRIHREYYRLPQSALEVAKVSKVLHMINTGKISEAADKDWNHVDVHEDVEMEQDSDESDEESVRNTEAADLQPQQKGNFTRKRNVSTSYKDELEELDDDVKDRDWEPPKTKRSKAQVLSDTSDEDDECDDAQPGVKKQKGREYMSEFERSVVQKSFESHINLFKVPGKQAIVNAQKKEQILSKFNWTKLKYCVHNIIQAKKRKLKGAQKTSFYAP